MVQSSSNRPAGIWFTKELIYEIRMEVFDRFHARVPEERFILENLTSKPDDLDSLASHCSACVEFVVGQFTELATYAIVIRQKSLSPSVTKTISQEAMKLAVFLADSEITPDWIESLVGPPPYFGNGSMPDLVRVLNENYVASWKGKIDEQLGLYECLAGTEERRRGPTKDTKKAMIQVIKHINLDIDPADICTEMDDLNAESGGAYPILDSWKDKIAVKTWIEAYRNQECNKLLAPYISKISPPSNPHSDELFNKQLSYYRFYLSSRGKR